MKNWKRVLLDESEKIMKAVEVLQETSLQLVLIVNESKQLTGVVTDGDIRRAILGSVSFDLPISTVMNKNPITISKETPRESIIQLFKNKAISKIPIVDQQKNIIDLCSIDDFINIAKYDNPVVIMAGGLGSRLGKLTDDVPKPLLKVGGKPILETILLSCIDQGLHDFYFSVNYKAAMIMDYFGNGAKWGVSIKYLEESKRLGTAGALKLMDENLSSPVLVMNGDLLTKINFTGLIEYHSKEKSFATMCVKEFEFEVPYGVIKIEDKKIVKIDEKPVQNFMINAGVYMLDPRVIDEVPENECFDMNQLFNRLIAKNENILVFPIHEYWLDIGKMKDFKRAQIDYEQKF